MLTTFLLVGLAVPFALAFPKSEARQRDELPLCNEIDRPCRCPAGTTFKNLTSFGIIGAPAIDVQSIMGSFFNFSYVNGLMPISTTGEDYVVGATRTFNLTAPAPPGFYETSDVLFRWETHDDGSFVQGFSQTPDPPVVYLPGGAEYHGEWCLIIGQQTVIANETAVAWKNWRCEIGETFPAASAHETGIRNTSALLRNVGKNTGVDVPAFTIWYEVRND